MWLKSHKILVSWRGRKKEKERKKERKKGGYIAKQK